MRIIAIANQKGGCAKTVTSVSLAAALVQMEKKVLLVDLDQQAHASIWLLDEEVGEGKGVFEVLVNKAKIKDHILTTSSGISLLPANAELASIELSGWTNVGARRLSRSLGELKSKEFDFVIIDCPPSLGLCSYNALVACQEVIVPVDCGPESYESTTRLKNTLLHIESEYGHMPTLIPLMTFLERTKIAQLISETAKNEFPNVLPPIRKNTSLPEAFAARLTIYQYDPNSIGALDYSAVAEQLILWARNN